MARQARRRSVALRRPGRLRAPQPGARRRPARAARRAGPVARRRLPHRHAPPGVGLRRSGRNPAAAAGHRRCPARSRGCSASPTCAATCCRSSTSSSSWKASARSLHEGQRVLVVRQPGGDVAVTIDELYGQRSFVERTATHVERGPDGDSPKAATPISSTGPTAWATIRGASSAWTGWPARPNSDKPRPEPPAIRRRSSNHSRLNHEHCDGFRRRQGPQPRRQHLAGRAAASRCSSSASIPATRPGRRHDSAAPAPRPGPAGALAAAGESGPGGGRAATPSRSPRSRRPRRRSTTTSPSSTTNFGDHRRRVRPDRDRDADTWAPLGQSADQLIASEQAVLAPGRQRRQLHQPRAAAAGAARRSRARDVGRRLAVLADLHRPAPGRAGATACPAA